MNKETRNIPGNRYFLLFWGNSVLYSPDWFQIHGNPPALAFWAPGLFSAWGSMLFNSTFENITCQAVVAHAFSPSPWEAEAGVSLWYQGQLGLQRESQDSQGYKENWEKERGRAFRVVMRTDFISDPQRCADLTWKLLYSNSWRTESPHTEQKGQHLTWTTAPVSKLLTIATHL